MIINIPLQIDEKVIEKNLSVDYENKIKDYILNEVKETLINRAKDKYKYFYQKPTATEGVEIYVHHYIDHYIQEWKNEIIEIAAEKLAERLAKTKAAKELIKSE